ncbi:MAG: hypothetical protein Q7R99_04200 [bacterium]|nr:hypothetical protein [bacterium]
MNVDGFKKIILGGTIILLLIPLFVFAQENTFALKEKQSLSILDTIRQYPLSTAQFNLYYDSIGNSDSENPIKAGAVMLVKQTILQNELDYWLVKMPANFSKNFIKAVYKIAPAVIYGDYSGVISLIEKYTVAEANKYIDNWMKQNQVLIGSGIGKYAFPSYKNNPQVIVDSALKPNTWD